MKTCRLSLQLFLWKFLMSPLYSRGSSSPPWFRTAENGDANVLTIFQVLDTLPECPAGGLFRVKVTLALYNEHHCLFFWQGDDGPERLVSNGSGSCFWICLTPGYVSCWVCGVDMTYSITFVTSWIPRIFSLELGVLFVVWRWWEGPSNFDWAKVSRWRLRTVVTTHMHG